MMRFTRLVAATAGRTVRSSRPSAPLLVAPRTFVASPAKVAKRLNTTLPLTNKSALSPAGKALALRVRGKKWTPVARRNASIKAKETMGPYLRFVAAVKKSLVVKGKYLTSKTASLWRSTRHIKDFNKRVDAAVRLAQKRKTKKQKTTLVGEKPKRKKLAGKKRTGVKGKKTGRKNVAKSKASTA